MLRRGSISRYVFRVHLSGILLVPESRGNIKGGQIVGGQFISMASRPYRCSACLPAAFTKLGTVRQRCPARFAMWHVVPPHLMYTLRLSAGIGKQKLPLGK